jgi:hypothetical protein
MNEANIVDAGVRSILVVPERAPGEKVRIFGVSRFLGSLAIDAAPTFTVVPTPRAPEKWALADIRGDLVATGDRRENMVGFAVASLLGAT